MDKYDTKSKGGKGTKKKKGRKKIDYDAMDMTTYSREMLAKVEPKLLHSQITSYREAERDEKLIDDEYLFNQLRK